VVWINKFTVYVGIAFVAHIVLLVVYKMRKHDDKEDREVYFGDTVAAE
jgi:preprotein translocase subunit SecG